MSEFQKPYSPSVTEETYRRIFHPALSCEGCFFSWKAKDSFPCRACTRVNEWMAVPFDGEKKDYFSKEYIHDHQDPKHFQVKKR